MPKNVLQMGAGNRTQNRSMQQVLAVTKLANFTFPFLCRSCGNKTEAVPPFLRNLKVCRDCFVSYSTVRILLES